MVNLNQWSHDFFVTDQDIDYLNTLLLEHEIPLTSLSLAQALVKERIRIDAEQAQKRFQDAHLYNPAEAYNVGDRIVFSTFDYKIGEVVNVRSGDNSEYGDFNVIEVIFEDDTLNTGENHREFASKFPVKHSLNTEGDSNGIPQDEPIKPEEIFESELFDDIIEKVDDRLREDDSLIQVAGAWFAKELMIDVNDGHIHLAEAILDMYMGGPLSTTEILENIGGIGSEPIELQVFSLNYGLNNDARFDEVGSADKVLWFLKRMEPEQVQTTPEKLRYTPISYDRDSLPANALDLELELADEHSPIPKASRNIQEARITLIYPHRRCGTLPLNYQAERIFPTANKTERIYVTLIDGLDNEEFPAWVVRKGRYVHGLNPLYTKHRLPIGSSITLKRGEKIGQIIVNFDAYKPRSEWVILTTAVDGKLGFQNAKRAIGAGYDDLLLLGVDDLEGVDKLFQAKTSRQQPLAHILRTIIPLLGKFTAQGHVHAKTLYSAVNVIRRCPPGPILATLINNPDFENVGEHYWQLS